MARACLSNMKILTGKHRVEHDHLLRDAATLEERSIRLEHEVSFLTKRIEELHADLAYEKERADRAIDSMLLMKGIVPVMPEAKQDLSRNLFEEDEKDAEKLRQGIEDQGLARVFAGESL